MLESKDGVHKTQNISYTEYDRLFDEISKFEEQLIGEYAKEQGRDIIKGGRLLPCLSENYVAYDNALQRNLKLLYEIGTKNVMTASDYHAAALMKYDSRVQG